MDTKRIDKLRKICTDAMNGPWSVTRTNNEFFINGGKMCGDEVRVQYNTKFISEARVALPEALDELERLRAALEEIRQENIRFSENAVMDWDGIQEIARKALEEK